MSEDAQRTVIKKIEELVNLNNSLKNLFKELIEIVAAKFEQVRVSLNQLKEQKIDLKELYDRILIIEESIRSLMAKPAVTLKPEPAPAREERVVEAAVKSIEEPVSVTAKISQATPSKGPVDDIFKYMASTLEANLSGEELAREFEVSRDKLMEFHSFHPVYHEIARVINTLRKYRDSKLSKRDVEELAAQIERWRDRMVC